MLKIVKQIIFFVPQLIKGLRFLFINFREFTIEGGISIHTQFKYKNQNLAFRTIVQLDGDIINFLPPLDKFKSDTKWYKEKYKVHKAKVRRVLAELDGLYTIPWTLAGILSSFSSYFVISTTKTTTYAGWIVTWIILTIIFRKFLCRYVLKTAIKSLINKKLKHIKASKESLFHSLFISYFCLIQFFS